MVPVTFPYIFTILPTSLLLLYLPLPSLIKKAPFPPFLLSNNLYTATPLSTVPLYPIVSLGNSD